MSTRAGKPLHWTPEKLNELRARMEPWMRQRTADAFQFKITGEGGLARAFQVSDDVCIRIVHQLMSEGLVQYRGASHLGYSWNGAVGRAVTLADLVAFAEAKVDRSAAAEKGRREMALARLTEAQFKDIKTVANLVAKYVPGAGGDQARVTSGWFGFDVERRAWAVEQHVARWSDEHHRDGWTHRATTDGVLHAVWSPRLNTLRSKHLGAIKNLLDLAATHDVIPRAARPELTLRSPATEWQPIVRRWKRWILKNNPKASPQMLDIGLRTLALTATRRRELSVRSTDWLAVRAEIEATFEENRDDRYVRQQRDCARYAWRRIVDALGPRIEIPAEFQWATLQDSRRSLVPDGAIVGAAAHATERVVGRRAAGRRGAQFDYMSTWTTRGDAYARSLVEGERGVADWITFSTAPADRLDRLGFPERAPINPTPEQLAGLRRAMGRNKQPYLLSYDTLVGRLRVFSQLAGWAHEHGDDCESLLGRRYDFVAADDLASLCDLSLVQAYSEWLRDDADEEDAGDELVQEGIAPSVCDLAIHLAKVATPFLEGRALKRADALREDGKIEEALAAEAEARTVRAAGFALKAWGYKHKPRDATRKDIVEIAEAWAGTDHRSGWLKLYDLVDLLVREAEEEVGLTIAQQLEAIRAAESAAPRERARLLAWQTPTWASIVRSAMLVNFIRKLPVRARAASEMRVDWWEALLGGKRVEPWHREAAVKVSIPGVAMKTKGRDYTAHYIRPELVGDPDQEAGARRDLVELWLRPHAAREFLLTEWEEVTIVVGDDECITERVPVTTIDSPYFFPASVTRGNGGRGLPRATRKETGLRWTPTSISVHFEEVVRAHADALHINLEALEKLYGALRLHVARLLYGTHHAPTNLLDASLMLHHADSAMTERLYCGRSAANAALEAPRDRRARTGIAPELEALRAALEQANGTIASLQTGVASGGNSEMIALLKQALADQRRENEELRAQLQSLQDRLLTLASAA